MCGPERDLHVGVFSTTFLLGIEVQREESEHKSFIELIAAQTCRKFFLYEGYWRREWCPFSMRTTTPAEMLDGKFNDIACIKPCKSLQGILKSKHILNLSPLLQVQDNRYRFQMFRARQEKSSFRFEGKGMLRKSFTEETATHQRAEQTPYKKLLHCLHSSIRNPSCIVSLVLPIDAISPQP